MSFWTGRPYKGWSLSVLCWSSLNSHLLLQKEEKLEKSGNLREKKKNHLTVYNKGVVCIRWTPGSELLKSRHRKTKELVHSCEASKCLGEDSNWRPSQPRTFVGNWAGHEGEKKSNIPDWVRETQIQIMMQGLTFS